MGLTPHVAYSHYAFITDREGDLLELEADHRQHAVVEIVIRDLKYGLALNHMPSGEFGANAAWLALNVIVHNLCLDGPPGSLRQHVPEDLAPAFPRSPGTARRARWSPTTATTCPLALAAAIPRASRQAPRSHPAGRHHLTAAPSSHHFTPRHP
jgi:hypothetical protein